MESEETFQKTFTIYHKHLQFLQQINGDNTSLALRTVLDSIISGQEQTQRKKILDNSLIFISFGFFFIILLSLTQHHIIYLISLGLGIFLILYGGIGGITNAIRRTQHYH